MERLEFFVQGSSSEPYQVVIEKNGVKLNGFCTCAAGSNAQSCKHVMRILSGSSEGIVSGEDRVALAASWLVGTAVESALNEVASVERKLEAAKVALSQAKKNLAKTLHN